MVTLGRYPEIKSFSAATYQISIPICDQICVIDIWNSECLLQQGVNYATAHCFSSDGNLFAASGPTYVYIWRYDSGHYIQWRSFLTQHVYTSHLQLSPTSLAIACCQVGLRVWRLDQPLVDAHADSGRQLAVLSHHGIYTATAHKWDSTIIVTNLLSESPPQTIDTDMSTETMAFTGDVLLVQDCGC